MAIDLAKFRAKLKSKLEGTATPTEVSDVTFGMPFADTSRADAFQTNVTTPKTTVDIPKSFKAPVEQKPIFGMVSRFERPDLEAGGGVTTPKETNISTIDVIDTSIRTGGALTKTLAQEFSKDWAAVGQNIAYQFNWADTKTIDPKTHFKNVLPDDLAEELGVAFFGNREFNIDTRDKEIADAIGLSDVNTLGGITSMFVLLDIMPSGQAVGVFKRFSNAVGALSKTDDLNKTLKVLRGLELSEEVIEQYAPILRTMDNEKDIARTLKEAAEASIRQGAGLPARANVYDEATTVAGKMRVADKVTDGNSLKYTIPPKRLAKNLSPETATKTISPDETRVQSLIKAIRAGDAVKPTTIIDTPRGAEIIDGLEEFIAARRLNFDVNIVEQRPSPALLQNKYKPDAVPPITETKPEMIPKSRMYQEAEEGRRIRREAGKPLEERAPQQYGVEQIQKRMHMEDAINYAKLEAEPWRASDLLGTVFQNDVLDFMRKFGFDKFDDIRLSIRKLGMNKAGEFNFTKKIVSLGKEAIREGRSDMTQVMIHELWHTMSRYLPNDKIKLLKNEYQLQFRTFRRNNPWFNFVVSHGKRINEDYVISPKAKQAFDKRYPGKAKFDKRPDGNWTMRWEDQYRFKNIDEFFAEEMMFRSTSNIVNPRTRTWLEQVKDVFWKIIDRFRQVFGKPRPGAFMDKTYDDFLKRKYPTMARDGPLDEASGAVVNKLLPDGTPKVRKMSRSREIPSLEKAAEQAGQPGPKPFTQPDVKKMSPKQQEALKERTMKSVMTKSKGYVSNMVERLKKAGYSDAEIDNIKLPTGHKLTDVVKFKREKTGAISAVITKKDMEEIKKSFTLKPPEKWAKKSLGRTTSKILGGAARMYELPQIFFTRIGLKDKIYTPIRNAERAAQVRKDDIMQKFIDAGLFKRGSWFTADGFKLSKKDSEAVGQYFLARQEKGYETTFEQLSEKAQKFVRLIDETIESTKEDFYKVATLNGKEPGDIPNYAPIMTREDIELVEQGGELDFIQRKHPGFFSLKERVPDVPVELYETDYRKVFAAWVEGVTRFTEVGKVSPSVKYLINSEDFKKIVGDNTWASINTWFKNTLSRPVPETMEKAAIEGVSRGLRKLVSVGALGLNYASVIKQSLSLIPVGVLSKARPKTRSKFAKAFGINVKELPSIRERKGSLAVSDMQGKIGRLFTGPLTEFDKTNAQLALNGLLDKEYTKLLKEGVELSPQMQAEVLRLAQDNLDMWFGGMTRGQLPPAFRGEVGRFINMFILPLTSQLNGFYRHIAKEKGIVRVKQAAEVMAVATAIAYTEQMISNLSPKWGDEKELTKDVLISLTGNIPILSQIVWALASDNDVQISAGLSGISNLVKTINGYYSGEKDAKELSFSALEAVGLPRVIERTWQGVEIIGEGGIRDKNGKLLAPVESTPEKIRALLRGKYGPLAAQDYYNNIGKSAEDRSWNVPEVEFLQNGDWVRRIQLVDEIGYDETLELVAEMSSGQQEDFWRYIYAKENPNPTRGELGAYLEEKGLDSDGRVSSTQMEAHERRVNEIAGIGSGEFDINSFRDKLKEKSSTR